MRRRDHIGGRNALSSSLRSSDGSILFRVSVYGHDSPRPDHPARDRPFCRRRVEAIGTHHGVLDIPTIDASSCREHTACFFSQVTEVFVDEQSPAAFTEHTSSFCLLSRSYKKPVPAMMNRGPGKTDIDARGRDEVCIENLYL